MNRFTSPRMAWTLHISRQGTGVCNQSLQAAGSNRRRNGMLHRSLSPAASPRGGASSLLRQGLGSPVTPLPTLRSQRPFVLTRQAFVPQQLSLFGPPGGGR